MNYVMIPSKGAERGAQRYAFDKRESKGELDCAFVYGDNSEELTQAVNERKRRIDFAHDFTEDYIHPDGFIMAKREVIVSVLYQGHGMPRRIVGAEIYPPHEDEVVHDREIAELELYMELSHLADLAEMHKTLVVVGLGNLSLD